MIRITSDYGAQKIIESGTALIYGTKPLNVWAQPLIVYFIYPCLENACGPVIRV